MLVSLIAAVDRNFGIGHAGELPWRLPRDMKHFRETTTGHHIMMGRLTFESIGRPLPNRATIVVSTSLAAAPEGTRLVRSPAQGLLLASERGESEVFVCGGGELYAALIDRADRLWLTHVEADTPADVHFPRWDPKFWTREELFQHPADEANDWSMLACRYTRKRRL